MKTPFTPLVAALPATVPFVGPETMERQRARPFAARLGANEQLFGPSLRAVAAMRAAAPEMWKYCDSSAHDLRMALARRHGLSPERIVIGEGIDGLLGCAVRMAVAQGDRVVTSDGAYPTFNYHVAGFGGQLIRVPYRDDREDPQALAAAAREHSARMVYFANPDNPMGTVHGAEAVAALLDALPQDCLLVLDEAYVEFARPGTAPDWTLDDPRLVRFRTFSKAYGLAGLRIGYAVADPVFAAGFDRVRNHFGINRMAQVAALAALDDAAHLDSVCDSIRESRARIAGIARACGLLPLESDTNFVAIDCGADGAHARAVLDALLARDVFVRMPGAAPLDRCIRVSCGPEAEMALLAEALPAALAEVASRRGPAEMTG